MPSLGTRLSYVVNTKITCHSSQGTENTPNESEGTKSYSWGTRGGIQASVCIRWYISLQRLISERFENFALYPRVITKFGFFGLFPSAISMTALWPDSLNGFSSVRALQVVSAGESTHRSLVNGSPHKPPSPEFRREIAEVFVITVLR